MEMWAPRSRQQARIALADHFIRVGNGALQRTICPHLFSVSVSLSPSVCLRLSRLLSPLLLTLACRNSVHTVRVLALQCFQSDKWRPWNGGAGSCYSLEKLEIPFIGTKNVEKLIIPVTLQGKFKKRSNNCMQSPSLNLPITNTKFKFKICWVLPPVTYTVYMSHLCCKHKYKPLSRMLVYRISTIMRCIFKGKNNIRHKLQMHI